MQRLTGVVDLAPETLNSLNELAAAINDYPAFYATIASQVSELNICDSSYDCVPIHLLKTIPTWVHLLLMYCLMHLTSKQFEAFALAYSNAKTAQRNDADSTLSGRI